MNIEIDWTACASAEIQERAQKVIPHLERMFFHAWKIWINPVCQYVIVYEQDGHTTAAYTDDGLLFNIR